MLYESNLEKIDEEIDDCRKERKKYNNLMRECDLFFDSARDAIAIVSVMFAMGFVIANGSGYTLSVSPFEALAGIIISGCTIFSTIGISKLVFKRKREKCSNKFHALVDFKEKYLISNFKYEENLNNKINKDLKIVLKNELSYNRYYEEGLSNEEEIDNSHEMSLRLRK